MLSDQQIVKYIEDYNGTLSYYASLYERFLVESVPIQSRKAPDYTKVNNKINNDFFGDLVKTKAGYMLGKPIIYTINDRQAGDWSEELRIFAAINSLHKKNLDTLKMSAICGTSSRLMYISKKHNMPKILNLKPWEVINVYDDTQETITDSIRVFKVLDSSNILYRLGLRTDKESEELEYVTKVEVYDEKTVLRYIYDGGKLYANTTEKTEQPHGFSAVPIIEYKNNEEARCEGYNVFELIDAYDRAVSDQTSELEQFRHAYLALYGLHLQDPESGKSALELMQQTGVFEVTENGKIEFVTKDIKDGAVMNILKVLKDNILMFGQSVDFTDERMMGALSGTAIKYRLTKLEDKCILTELMFSDADQTMWELFANFMNITRTTDKLEFYNIERKYTRSIPINMLEEARTQRELLGTVSNETRLSTSAFIDNPKDEMDRMRNELVSGTELELDTLYDALNNRIKAKKSTLNDSNLGQQKDTRDDLRPYAHNNGRNND